VAYHNNRTNYHVGDETNKQTSRTRRAALLAVLAVPLASSRNSEQEPDNDRRLPIPPNPNADTRLPNGKSQKDAIAKQSHEQALKEADELVSLAQKLKDELKSAGEYVVPVASVQKTEQIEKLAKRIRSRLKS
jgi:hypothetical protein